MKIAIIVQRAGRDFTGGSESYAMTLAQILSDNHQVDILTTTARDHMTWASAFPAGNEVWNGNLNLIRFPTRSERGAMWNDLSGQLETLAQNAPSSRAFYRNLPLGIAEGWIKAQGPDCPDLIHYLEDHQDSYDRFVFLTYLYSTTYFGVQAIADKNKVLVVPTFHDENPAYLPVFLRYADLRLLFLTPEEQEIAEKHIYGRRLKGTSLGFGLEDKEPLITAPAPAEARPYVLYAGRLEEAKGVGQLFEYFERYCKEHPGLALYTIGNGKLASYLSENIIYKGFVDEDEKLHYMKHALCFAHPSPFESLSIVLLESFMMGSPGLVNGHCAVLKGHVQRSGCGFHYENYDSFAAALECLRQGEDRQELSQKGRAYFEQHYSRESFMKRIENCIVSPSLEEARP